MQVKDKAKGLGAKLLREAKTFKASKIRGTKCDMNQAILESVSSEVRQPITVMGDPVKSFEHRQKNKIECCICHISAGTFYIKNGEKFCSDHKDFMNMSERERKEMLYVS